MFVNALPFVHGIDRPAHIRPTLTLRRRVWEIACGIRGHDLMLHVERGRRMFLRCETCGHETPGWNVR